MQPAYKPEKKGKILGEVLARALSCKERKTWLDTGEEISKFAYNMEVDKLMKYDAVTDRELFFKAALHKAAEYVETVGPGLYQNNPDRRVIARDWASDQQKARSVLEQQYLNYTPGETDLSTHSRRCINQSLIYGMGSMWTGYNPSKGCTQNIYDDVRNVILDPDAKVMEDSSFIMRKRLKPRWWLLDKYGEDERAKTVIASLRSAEGDGQGKSSEMIAFYEGYFRVGLHHYCNGEPMGYEEAGGERIPVRVDAPIKYIFTDDGKYITEGEWEVPYFLDDKWPVELLTYRDMDNGVYPASPLAPGLGHLKALNWIYSLYLSMVHVTTRSIIGIAKINGNGLSKDDVAKAIHGSGLEFLEFEVNGGDAGVKLGDFIQQFNFQAGVVEFERFASIVESAFERATGLSAFVSMGSTDRQMRSAAEANLKDRIAHSRFEDMRVRVEQWQSKIARKEAQAARFLLTEEDITKTFGPQAGQLWGKLMPPAEVMAQKLRDEVAQSGAQLDPVQIETVIGNKIAEAKQTGVVYEEWLRESDYTIEAGSIRRVDIEQQIDSAGVAMNQAFPALMQAGEIQPAMIIMQNWAKLNNMPKEMQDALVAANQQMQQKQAQQQAMKQQQAQQAQQMEMMKLQQSQAAAQPQPQAASEPAPQQAAPAITVNVPPQPPAQVSVTMPEIVINNNGSRAPSVRVMPQEDGSVTMIPEEEM